MLTLLLLVLSASPSSSSERQFAVLLAAPEKGWVVYDCLPNFTPPLGKPSLREGMTLAKRVKELMRQECREVKLLLKGLQADLSITEAAPFRPNLLVRVSTASPMVDLLIETHSSRFSVSPARSAVPDRPSTATTGPRWSRLMRLISP